MAQTDQPATHGYKLFALIGRWAVKYRYLVVLFWLILIPIVSSNFPSITAVEHDTVSDFLPKNSPTNAAANLESVFVAKKTATNSVIVISRSSGILDSADNQAIKSLSANVLKVPQVTEVRDLGVSADGQAQELLIGISGAGFGQRVDSIVGSLRSAVASTHLPSDLTAHVTGTLAAAVDQDKSNKQGRNRTEGYTVILIIVLLLIVFRSLVAPFVTLLPAGVALAVAQPVIAESTKIGVQVGFITQILLIVLLLGAGTDYGLFLVFRVREEIKKGLAPKAAVEEALLHVGESISFSAATVMAALLALLLATFGLYRGLGPALAIGLGIMLLIALTFLPALLAILGKKVFWPSKVKKQPIKIGLWGKLAEKATDHPITVMLFGVILFGALMLGLSGYRSAGFGAQKPPAGTDSAAGAAVLSAHFPAANNNPEILILKFKHPVWNNLAAVQTAENDIEHGSQFKDLSGPFNANNFKLTPDQLAQVHAAGRGPILAAVSQFISPDGRTVQFYGILKAGETGSTAAMRQIPAVRSELASVAGSVGASTSAVYGSDAVAYDINHVTNTDLKHIIPIVLVVIALLLAIMLKSLVAPWYLILTVGLSYLASLGFAMIVFVHLGHQDGLDFVLPFLMFVFGMALGEDYNILVMSRIREEAFRTSSLKEAIHRAIGITGTTVTSAGLILAGTFSILGLVGGNEQVQQIGFGVAFGILLDTFFVRTLLVPSIAAKLGKLNWWPSKLSK